MQKIQISEAEYVAIKASNHIAKGVKNILGVAVNKTKLKDLDKAVMIKKLQEYERVKYYWSNATRLNEQQSQNAKKYSNLRRIQFGSDKRMLGDDLQSLNRLDSLISRKENGKISKVEEEQLNKIFEHRRERFGVEQLMPGEKEKLKKFDSDMSGLSK
ncbi:hypothetical protein [Allofrancisella frigidaquae]|uniref:Uncharacterized protein n=1 Tax=Allofrancisella frigidaquae TaxID=1085644 RepID=A0A6M3HVY6_9GAMM|nr:hypothetical protein [Allofrancisella frigidaquae]QIV93936.1 hypothetical protein E3E15_00605 [Allofrancisella frigidaquae]